MDGASHIQGPAVKKVNRAVTFRRERLSDVVTDLGPLLRMHDRELWPGRTWGRIAPNFPYYMQMEAQGLLHIIGVRTTGGRLVGYSADFITLDNHYGVITAINDMFFVHPEYRMSGGLLSNAYKLLKERETLFDEKKATRRLVRPKMVRMFGPMLERLGYKLVAYEFQKIGNPA